MSMYADDVVVFVTQLEANLHTIKAILEVFGCASGLFSSLEKSVVTPMHCTESDMLRVQEILACGVAEFPIHYLGIPLSVYKLKCADEQPLVDKVAVRLPTWKGGLLNIVGRTTFFKATLSAIPVHTTIALVLSPWAIQAIDKLRHGFI